MSKYSELIKKFDKIRDYTHAFYIYGFKSRDDFDVKSLRSYDNEKRRIESYLAEYMSFSQDKNGKNIYIELDCSEILENPLYRIFKTKSFTKNDITLHFIILDILTTSSALSAPEIAEIIANDYLSVFENPILLDLSTIRNKLLEYEELGLLISKKEGKKRVFLLNRFDINLESLSDALLFFSETSPLGVVGSFMIDKLGIENQVLSYKHHYIMHALESEIVLSLIQAIDNKQTVILTTKSHHNNSVLKVACTPLKILIGAQTGRRYVSVLTSRKQTINNYRLDAITEVYPTGLNENYDQAKTKFESMLQYIWGSSFGDGQQLEEIKMTLQILPYEKYIITRILREGRHGTLKQIDETKYEYFIKVYDCSEMLPWLRTFIGRIISLEGTNKIIIDLFYADLNKMNALYGGV